MKNLILLLSFTLLTSCNQQSEKNVINSKDPVLSSEVYKNYVAAYNDYASCKMERPQLTNDFMEKKMTSEEFTAALEKNAKSCNIKKEIFNKYYQLLEAEFEKTIAAKHKIME
ncbi:hypothetical protein A9Q93_01235 [Nonlabens dokdonensis]|uniref:Lipoprotein n=1 Tax=Nonlabens dokdonensis TaxID=328515 RepID=A0A1Z8BF96_9FLAO|nr:hypothetical protein [Nonlabens dokdonensis]OUS21228.1 hypothetical protein A9Q93_01235 [Nonlabens dokdonensis]